MAYVIYYQNGVIKEAGLIDSVKNLYNHAREAATTASKKNTEFNPSRRAFLKKAPLAVVGAVLAAKDASKTVKQNAIPLIHPKNPIRVADRVGVYLVDTGRTAGKVRQFLTDGKIYPATDYVVDHTIKPLAHGVESALHTAPGEYIANSAIGKSIGQQVEKVTNPIKKGRQFYLDNLDTPLHEIEDTLLEHANPVMSRRQFIQLAMLSPTLRDVMLRRAGNAYAESKGLLSVPNGIIGTVFPGKTMGIGIDEAKEAPGLLKQFY